MYILNRVVIWWIILVLNSDKWKDTAQWKNDSKDIYQGTNVFITNK